ncbi:flocculation protein FLO11-like [Alligator mississippiensis]|uniref:Flocculation protein FLO11-like n=1 Tax=Alligator mississippiensis TaxID=8496 RepID=A0A151MZB9_ALLMI|nr:flocculation protein FLO11-like [Alligator mississippiensis]
MGRLGPWWLVLLLSWAVPGSVWAARTAREVYGWIHNTHNSISNHHHVSISCYNKSSSIRAASTTRTTAAPETSGTAHATMSPSGTTTARMTTTQGTAAPTQNTTTTPSETSALPWPPSTPGSTALQSPSALPTCPAPPANATANHLLLSLDVSTSLNLTDPAVRDLILSTLLQDLKSNFPCTNFTLQWRGETKQSPPAGRGDPSEETLCVCQPSARRSPENEDADRPFAGLHAAASPATKERPDPAFP